MNYSKEPFVLRACIAALLQGGAMILTKREILNTYLGVIGIAFFLSGITQVSTQGQKLLSSHGDWNLASGWQREIALFNFAAVLLIALAIWSRRLELLISLTYYFVVLTFLLGTNHLLSFYQGDIPSWHLILAFLNFLGFGFGVLALYIDGYGHQTDDS